MRGTVFRRVETFIHVDAEDRCVDQVDPQKLKRYKLHGYQIGIKKYISHHIPVISREWIVREAGIQLE